MHRTTGNEAYREEALGFGGLLPLAFFLAKLIGGFRVTEKAGRGDSP